ncbi:hypothetical protein PAF17_19230, partial [Paracoccus sp. Z330]
PELDMPGTIPSPARRVTRQRETRKLLKRHVKNRKQLFDEIAQPSASICPRHKIDTCVTNISPSSPQAALIS